MPVDCHVPPRKPIPTFSETNYLGNRAHGYLGRARMDPLITPTDAENLILNALPELGTETIPLPAAGGRILATELTADRPLPPYDRVMMDGICFRSSDLGDDPLLTVAGIHAAGDPHPAPLSPGQCWEVMTGACFPLDCDTVVPYELITRHGENSVAFPKNCAQPGKHVHRAGSDYTTGDLLVPAHARIDSRVAAVAATVGATELEVLRKPRVVIFTTGDEVIDPGASPAPHQVRQSNSASLRTALAVLGTELVHHQHLPDDKELTTEAVRANVDCDLILLCGGISKGKRDYVRPVMESLLGPPSFHGIAQRPGKPLAFWQGPPPIFALPGNPMSVQVCFHRYVRPYLDALQHQRSPVRTVRLGAPFQFKPPFSYSLPVRLRQDGAALVADLNPLANSGDFASAIASDGFIELPAEESNFPEGFLAPFREWL